MKDRTVKIVAVISAIISGSLLAILGFPGDSTDPPMYPKWPTQLGMAGPTDDIEVHNAARMEIMTVNGINGTNGVLERPKLAETVVVKLWTADGREWRANWIETDRIITNVYKPSPELESLIDGSTTSHLDPKVMSRLKLTTNDFPQPKVDWMNDAVYYETNSVFDHVRTWASCQPGGLPSYCTKDVVSTNKIWPTGFSKGDRKVEIGFRDDGVIVWRNMK